jgi:hypothetical protein
VFELKTGETRERMDIVLSRYGSIVGHIVDESGDPIDNVRVSVMQIRVGSGPRRVTAVGGAGASSRRTDELGRYRLYGLPPGDYIVTASVGGVGADDMPGYATTYFPGTPNVADADLVKVGVSEDVSSVDFPLSQTRTASVSGTTLLSNGDPFQGGVRMRASRRSGGLGLSSVGAKTKPDGSFEFPNVAPGEYIIEGFRGREVGWQVVTVNGADLTGIVVQTLPGSTVSGRITFDGGTEMPRRAFALFSAAADPDFEAPNGGTNAAEIRPDWTFEMSNLIGPRRLRVPRAPAGWALRAILVNGVDVSDAVLSFGTAKQSLSDVSVVMTNQVTDLIGTVTGTSEGTPSISGATAANDVLIFSTDRDRWFSGSRYIARRRSAADGTFHIEGLPAGQYFVVAPVAALPGDGAWQDPSFLAQLERDATRTVLTEGQKTVVSLTVR